MPTSTFYRLPEEKRLRLIRACWTEFTRVRFADISINRIISTAHIPRGSFYQYFSDKEDMIRYLLKDMRECFVGILEDILAEAEGDLFAVPLGAFDRFLRQEGSTDPMLHRFIQVIRLNRGINDQTFWVNRPELLPDQLWERVDPRRLRQGSREFAEHVFFLTMAVLAYAVAETLQDPAQWSRQRETLQARVELLRCGCAAADEKEATV